jgi:hypothetical protein
MRATLVQEIREALGSAVSPNLNSRSKGFDLFEAYVFALGIKACTKLKLPISYKNTDGTAASTFRFRTSPGSLARSLYSHAEIQLGTRKPAIEAHVGAKVMGVSKVEHEMDFSIIFKDEADFCRRNDVLPRHSKVVMATECKFYTRQSVGIAMGRAFVGLCADLVLFFINTITYYLRSLFSPCYARFGRALICHERARTRSSLPNKSERSWNDVPINIRYHILL